jgi:hypothetical protein
MPVKLAGDPDRHIRYRGGRFQARPWRKGRHYHLGFFDTVWDARRAVYKFWQGSLSPVAPGTKAYRTGKWTTTALRYAAYAVEGGRRVRLPGWYDTREEAAEALRRHEEQAQPARAA